MKTAYSMRRMMKKSRLRIELDKLERRMDAMALKDRGHIIVSSLSKEASLALGEKGYTVVDLNGRYMVIWDVDGLHKVLGVKNAKNK